MNKDYQAAQAIAVRIFAAKRDWRRKVAALTPQEKVRILLRMQRDDYPILLKRGNLKPWEIEP